MSVAVYKKLLAAKKKVPYLQKDKSGFNYRYVTPTAVFGVVNPILNELGLILVTNVIDVKSYEIAPKIDKNGKLKAAEWKFDLNFIFDWVDVESGEKISIPWSASGCNGDDKGLGSALTYGERYFILKQFNIPTDEDDPDSFQEKHQSEDEKVKGKQSKISSAIALIYATETLKELQDVWVNNKPLQTDPAFIAAKDMQKAKLATPGTTKEESKEHAGDISNGTN